MTDALRFAELEGQEVELLPARTVLSFYGGSWGPFDPHFEDNSNDSEANAIAWNENDIDIDNENYNDNESEAEATGLDLELGSLFGTEPPPDTETPPVG